MKVSLAITSFNRSGSVITAFEQVLGNDLVDEIVIVDDHSKAEEYVKLWNLINNLGNNKIKLYRNTTNLKPFQNKYTAVSKCSNEWVILLDSDNIIDNEYIKTITKLEKEDDILYVAETLYRAGKADIGWSYKAFNGLTITKRNVKRMMNEPLFEAFLNTGNHFFNRHNYMQVVESTREDPLLSVNDAIYFSYLWLLNRNRMKVVPGLYYIHQASEDSWWATHEQGCTRSAKVITLKIRRWRVT